jgi:hypothetical protein
MDAQKVKALTNATKSSFESFVGLRSFLIMGDLMFHLLTLVYKNIQDNILDPILDPYIPENFLVFHPTEKITLNLGKFLVNFFKTVILAYLTFKIFVYTEPYFNRYLKKGGG